VAQYAFGILFQWGKGVTKNEATAAAWFTRAAEQNFTGAQETLGEFYRDGKGVKKDDAIAVKWFQRAAENGDAVAQFNLGVMYRNGRGVAPDPVEAHKWIMLAAARVTGAEAEKSHAIARDNHAAELTPAQVAQAQKRARDWMDAHPDRAPAPTPAPSQPVRVGGPVKQPTKLKNVAPVYPDIAKEARVQGVVIIDCTIGIDGRVVDAKILRSIPLLDQAALDAVRQWEFTPTILDGVPVPLIMTVTVNFSLA
jgi:TonB family protein